MKLLAVDIGNTSIHFALHARGRWHGHFWLPTYSADRLLRRSLLRKARLLKNADALVASVVPAKTRVLKRILRSLGLRCREIGKEVGVPIVNRYRRPRQVGVDRLLNALAAWRRCARETIVVDFGTAITFDVVGRKGEYLGGVIAPGIEISLEALFRKTALLPKIRLRHPRHWIGKDTVESIRVGCSVGIGGLCDRVVEAISRKYRMRPAVLATGGYAAFMKRYCRRIQSVQKDLLLDGILLTYRDFLSQKSRLTK